jgi:type IV pilus assembly protein PilY1
MKYLSIPLLVLLQATASYADDTEVYGTAGANSEKQGNPNVLFILDTSGSMRGEVSSTTLVPFNPSNNYTNDDNILNNLNSDADEGWPPSTFNDGCSTYIDTLNLDGFVEVNAYQLIDGENKELFNEQDTAGTISCFEYAGGTGYAYRLYSPDYAKWNQNAETVTVTSTRMDIMKGVITNLTGTLKDVNLGLMRFKGSNGGTVDVAVDEISISGPLINTAVLSYTPNGWTPLTESLHEAALYFRGEASIYNSGTYRTPINKECQKNHVILFTDGSPQRDSGSNSDIHTYLNEFDSETKAAVTPALNGSCSGNGGCLDELAYWMRNTDHTINDDDDDDNFTNGDHYITVHTIGGFGLSGAQDILGPTAEHGKGNFFEADDAVGITAVVAQIFKGILESDTTFTAPAVSVNAFNSSENNNELYYALFRPEDTIRWGGNLKKYTLENRVIMDHGGQTINTGSRPAIDDETGFFATTSYDYWNGTDFPDGKTVTDGGFARILDVNNRTIYTENSSGSLVNFGSVASYNTFGIPENTDITFSDSDVYKWVVGYNAPNGQEDGDDIRDRTANRYEIGDPLHSEPVIMTYGGTTSAPDSTIFFGTNQGFIHAVNTTTGIEEFAFLPEELHDIQNDYFENTKAAEYKPYGMDGPLSFWFKDVNDDSLLLKPDSSVQEGEHIYLYAGMRRGGRSYYALNISDRDNPKLLFKITGGETTDFDNLGQTWSKMTAAKVRYLGESRFVLFFGGGYDTNQDSNVTREDDDLGNSIYMVDATTGALLWSAGKTGADLNISDMKNSIPASISAIDIKGDGYVDYLFAADTGGRIFRFDIDQDSETTDSKSDFAQGGLIAEVGDSSVSGNRRFYNKPTVALVVDKEIGNFLTIAIGSGYRAHPLDDSAQDRFYVIKDRNPYESPTSYTVIKESSVDIDDLSTDADSSLMYNNTDSLLIKNEKDVSQDLKNALLKSGGWYVELGTEEKSLSEALISSSTILFSTFISNGGEQNSCGADTGTSAVYGIDQRYGIAALDPHKDGDPIAKKVLKHSGIAPRPVVIFRDGEEVIIVGTEVVSEPEDEGTGGDDFQAPCETGNCYVTPIYWRQNDNN